MEQGGQAKEASGQMDLSGWNSDLDSSLLSGWSENNESNTRTSSEEPMPKDRRDSGRSSSRARSFPRDDANNWDGNLNQLSQLPAFSEDYEAAPYEQSKASVVSRPASNSSAALNTSEIASVNSISRDGVVSEESSERSSRHVSQRRPADVTAPRLHPQAIQSSATCPPHGNSNQMLPPNYFPNAGQQVTQGQNMFGMNLSQPMTNMNDAVSLATSLQQSANHSASSSASSTYNQSQTLSSLAANFMLAQNNSAVALPHLGQMAAVQPQSSPTSTSSNHIASKPSNARGSRSPANLGSSSSRKSRRQAQPPPFYLFDAPIELRANFNKNQRRLGIPVQDDCNSYHYGEAVKGFHPQHLLSNQQGHQSSHAQKNRVQLIDARHGSLPKSGRAKNEREQRRAQKITDLIDQLRINMEKGGWKVEVKSKFHTLSSCAEYVKHMVKATNEKEETVKKLKAELKVKQQKMEDDNAVQESRSDPESVTSSLTTSTNGSSLSTSNAKADQTKKRKLESNSSDNHQKRSQRSRVTSSIASTEDSSGTSGGPSNQSFCIDKTVSSVSDVTDSNRGSSSNTSGSSGSGSGGGSTEQEQAFRVSADETTAVGEQPSSSSISSDAAVANETSSREQQIESRSHDHKDVVFNNDSRSDRKRPPGGAPSGERSSELDYEEVFDNSNVPQLIAGTSGKIVSWNRCFLKATGLPESDVERMTIFSLVNPDKLSNFFELVAEALRCNDEPSHPSSLKNQEKSSGEESSNESQKGKGQPERQWNYAAMTLPCIDFPAMKKLRKSNASMDLGPLHVTIALMSDKDPRKRCFHCTFTNCSGTNGSLGVITPDLLAALFSNPETSSTKRSSHHGRRHKRARITENSTTPTGETKD